MVVASLLGFYPVRLLYHAWKRTNAGQVDLGDLFHIPSSFDPAPLLYPLTLPIYVALSISCSNKFMIVSNIVLGLSSLPDRLIPDDQRHAGYSTVHWCLASLPAAAATRASSYSLTSPTSLVSTPAAERWEREQLSALYPIHRALVHILQNMASTSLLPAETQLLSVGLINSLLHSTSPQGIILKALLWGGGLGMIVLCGPVLKWGLVLARIPRWRFRRSGQVVRAHNAFLAALRPRRRTQVDKGSDADEDGPPGISRNTEPSSIRSTSERVTVPTDRVRDNVSITAKLQAGAEVRVNGGTTTLPDTFSPLTRRHTSPTTDSRGLREPRAVETESGRRHRRSTSSNLHPYLALTASQAAFRKWLYAAYVYVMTFSIIFFGIRSYVQKHALDGHEPIGWAIGYLFAGIPWLKNVMTPWIPEEWICLASNNADHTTAFISPGFVEYLRYQVFGAANTRLVIMGYCLGIVVTGLTLVIHLSGAVEVDTRRKVFHGMMVAMFLPATFIDPVFAGFAMALVLAIFLVLDVFRASQLPPLSKPLAYFLTPYVDGRDLRGPVVVSHIFLLIGCAVPLWLSLASVGRTGQHCWRGWDVPVRDLGMVSGIVCVGMGDAAASLVGRRFGRRKWPWSGGKSLEGSAAFFAAVIVGLNASRAWLLVGGWPTLQVSPVQDHHDSIKALVSVDALAKTTLAAAGASLTEAVLTGGNDNVIVPIVLWLLVKGFKL